MALSFFRALNPISRNSGVQFMCENRYFSDTETFIVMDEIKDKLFYDIKKPELRSHIDGWHDNPFCSIERNLKFMQFCAEAYYKASKPFADLNKMPKWVNRIVAFDEINKVLFKVLRDHEKLISHAFVDAVYRVQYIHQNQTRVSQLTHAV